jgi:hypothetical protein
MSNGLSYNKLKQESVGMTLHQSSRNEKVGSLEALEALEHPRICGEGRTKDFLENPVAQNVAQGNAPGTALARTYIYIYIYIFH